MSNRSRRQVARQLMKDTVAKQNTFRHSIRAQGISADLIDQDWDEVPPQNGGKLPWTGQYADDPNAE